MRLQKVISGGQTGVDRAALDAALNSDLSVGGWCPQGRRAEDGVIPERYPLRETPAPEYKQRTAWNVRDSDGTLLITRGTLDGGSAFTKAEAKKRGRPVLEAHTNDPVPVPMIRAWGEEHDIRTLNVAGPRESEEAGVYEEAYVLLERLFEEILADWDY